MSDDATAPENPTVEAPVSDPAQTSGDTLAQTSAAHPRTRHAVPALVQDYSERLYAAWWVWLFPLAGAALLAASVHRGYPGLPSWLPYAIMLPIAVFIMLAMSRGTIRVVPQRGSGDPEADPGPTDAERGNAEPGEAELRVGQAHLPVRFIGSVEVIDKEAKRLTMGPQLDPAAFIVHRGSIGPLLRVELTDPDDDTPYWLFSTRKPEKLARALGAAH